MPVASREVLSEEPNPSTPLVLLLPGLIELGYAVKPDR